MIELKPGQKLDDQLLKDLRLLVLRAGDVRQGRTQIDRLRAYRKYSDQALRVLRHRLTSDEVARTIQTKAHWALLESDSVSLELVDLEGEDLERRMTDLHDRATSVFKRWEKAPTLVVPDTNLFLRVLEVSDDPIASTDWWELADIEPGLPITVVLPVVVIDELDRAKRNNQVKARARAVLKEINGLLGDRIAAPVDLSGNRLRFDVFVPPPSHVPLPVADDEIVSQVEAMEALCLRPYRPRLLTNDTGMLIRSKVAAVDVRHVDSPDDR